MVPQVLREIWPWIAALLLLVLCVEWWLFSRSYQSAAPSQNKGKAAYSHTSSISQQGKQSGTIGAIQVKLAARYRTLQKRTAKITKRIKSNRTWHQSTPTLPAPQAGLPPLARLPAVRRRARRRRTSKGNSDANV